MFFPPQHAKRGQMNDSIYSDTCQSQHQQQHEAFSGGFYGSLMKQMRLLPTLGQPKFTPTLQKQL